MSRPDDEYPSDERMYPSAEWSAQPALDPEAERGLGDLSEGRWAAAEQRFAAVLTQVGGGPSARALAVVGGAQARLFGRRDARGAFAMLQTLFGRPKRLAPLERARLHLVAAFLFADDDPAVHDRARATQQVELARAALEGLDAGELSTLCAVVELLLLALAGDAARFLQHWATRRAELVADGSPVTRCLLLEVEAVRALAAGERELSASLVESALEAARALGFAAAEARLVVRAGRPTLDACLPPERHGPQPSSRGARRRLTFELEDGLEREVRRLGPSRVTVLLVGESSQLIAGVARALHERSGRAQQPFVSFDCRALPAVAVELELFGGPDHRGSVGGAVRDAGSGTLHVAAIDELPLLIQPRFLRFLDEDKRVRVVVSTALDLQACVERGRFRRDLGERLTLVQLLLPSGRRTV
jgi:hypothetical protein